MDHLELTLPLQNPVLKFSLILFIVLFAPIVLNRLKIPPLIGLIIAGAVIGPNGLNLFSRDSSIILFGTVGLLYIMFLAGLEIDMADFKKNKYKSMLFGLFTFSIPMVLGTVVSYYYLKYPINSSILLASMFASHTLIAYPIVSKYGVIRNRAVNITVGGTIITDTLALLVLAIIVGIVKGNVGQEFWIRLSVSFVIFCTIVLFVFPILARWFFKKQGDAISQYIFVLGIVFMSAFLAELAGVEAIIGAFLAGLALNRLIPHTSPLMNRIEFVGNALFIPFFLIGVGMLIDYRVFISSADVLIVAIVMTVVAISAKLLAAYLAKLSFKFSRDEFMMMFGLSNAQAAATLAAVLVGYNIIIDLQPDGTAIRLLNEDVLNGTIVMILVTCTVSSFAASKAAQNLALTENNNTSSLSDNDTLVNRFMIPIAYPDNIEPLVNFAIFFKNKKAKNEFIALNIRTENSNGNNGKKLLEIAQKAGAALDTDITTISRYDQNISNGIINSIKENNITDVILGMHHKSGFTDSFFGSVLETIINKTDNNLFIIKSFQPINTINKLVVVVPERAELEQGFLKWTERIHVLSKELNSTTVFYASTLTLGRIQKSMNALEHNLPVSYQLLDDWEDFLIISRDLQKDALLTVINARKNSVSYNKVLDKLPRQLTKYFNSNNIMIIYPEQFTQQESELRRLTGTLEG